MVPLHFVFPGIAGKITDEAHEWTKEAFVAALRKAGKLDGVFLQLHGTAATDSLDDCEGDLLAAIRGVRSATGRRSSHRSTAMPT